MAAATGINKMGIFWDSVQLFVVVGWHFRVAWQNFEEILHTLLR